MTVVVARARSSHRRNSMPGQKSMWPAARRQIGFFISRVLYLARRGVRRIQWRGLALPGANRRERPAHAKTASERHTRTAPCHSCARLDEACPAGNCWLASQRSRSARAAAARDTLLPVGQPHPVTISVRQHWLRTMSLGAALAPARALRPRSSLPPRAAQKSAPASTAIRCALLSDRPRSSCRRGAPSRRRLRGVRHVGHRVALRPHHTSAAPRPFAGAHRTLRRNSRVDSAKAPG